MQRSHSDTCISHGPDGDRYHNCLHIHLRSQTMHDHVHVFGSRHCRNLHIDNPTGCITCELPICGTISNHFNNFDMLKDICLRLSELANMVLCSPWKTSDNNKWSKCLNLCKLKKVQYTVYGSLTQEKDTKHQSGMERINLFCVDNMVTSKLVIWKYTETECESSEMTKKAIYWYIEDLMYN